MIAFSDTLGQSWISIDSPSLLSSSLPSYPSSQQVIDQLQEEIQAVSQPLILFTSRSQVGERMSLHQLFLNIFPYSFLWLFPFFPRCCFAFFSRRWLFVTLLSLPPVSSRIQIGFSHRMMMLKLPRLHAMKRDIFSSMISFNRSLVPISSQQEIVVIINLIIAVKSFSFKWNYGRRWKKVRQWRV